MAGKKKQKTPVAIFLKRQLRPQANSMIREIPDDDILPHGTRSPFPTDQEQPRTDPVTLRIEPEADNKDVHVSHIKDQLTEQYSAILALNAEYHLLQWVEPWLQEQAALYRLPEETATEHFLENTLPTTLANIALQYARNQTPSRNGPGLPSPKVEKLVQRLQFLNGSRGNETLTVRTYNRAADALPVIPDPNTLHPILAQWSQVIIHQEKDTPFPQSLGDLEEYIRLAAGLTEEEWESARKWGKAPIKHAFRYFEPATATRTLAVLEPAVGTLGTDALINIIKNTGHHIAQQEDPDQAIRQCVTVITAFRQHVLELEQPENTDKRPRRENHIIASTLRAALHKATLTAASGATIPEDRPWYEWLSQPLQPWNQGPDAETGRQEAHRIFVEIRPLAPDDSESIFPHPETAVQEWPLHPEMATQPDKATESTLLKRGWTKDLIAAILEQPDELARNPHCRAAAPMRLYNKERVEQAEQGQKFRHHSEKKMQRSLSARRGNRTKRLNRVSGHVQEPMWLYVPAKTADGVRGIVAAAKPERLLVVQTEDGPATGAAAPTDTECVDFMAARAVRHPEPNPETGAEPLRPAVEKDIQQIRRTRALRAIAQQWPQLAQECDRQIKATPREARRLYL